MMSPSPPPHDEPELVPPAELLRLRAMLSRSPDSGTRARHLAAITSAAREGIVSGPAGRFARRGVRVAVAAVASLAITSGLAGAQLLPQPAQRLLSSVGERLSPSEDAPPAPTAEPADEGDDRSERDATPLAVDREQADTTTTEVPATTSTTTPPTSESSTTTTEPPPTTTTTIPGPSGPGSPDDPTDGGSTDGGSTDAGSTDGSSTDGGSTDGVGTAETDGGTGDGSTGTSTTEVPSEGPTTTVGGSD